MLGSSVKAHALSMLSGTHLKTPNQPCPIIRSRSDTPVGSNISSNSPLASPTDRGIISTPPRRTFCEPSRTALDRRGNSTPPGSIKGFKVKSKRASDHNKSLYSKDAPHGLLGDYFGSSRSAHKLGDNKRARVALQETLSHNISSDSLRAIPTSSKWSEAKRLDDGRVLHHPTVQRAHVLAATIHEGVLEPDGSSVLGTLEDTAIIVARLGLDAATVAAAVLHRCLDDERVTEELLQGFMPMEVIRLVSGVSKASRVSKLYKSQPLLHEESSTEKLRTMLIALADVRVMLIQLAKRLQSARRLPSMDPAARCHFVLTTEAIFIPIASRLGIWSIKAELEDLCFQATKPEVYAQLCESVNSKLKASKATISEFITESMVLLKQADVVVEDIEGRPKSLSSIRAKLLPDASGKPGKSLDSIHDVLAVRIIVPTKNDCYKAHREILKRWPRQQGREKNYIRDPKSNGYQSHHDVFISDSGLPIEVQIRTPHMHWNAEFGIASHWRYKEKGLGRSKEADVRGGCQDTDAEVDNLIASHEHLIAWSRMVLTYGHRVREYNKATIGAHLQSTSTDSTLQSLTDLTQDLMKNEHVDGLPQPRRASIAGHPGAGPPQGRTSFVDFVASSMTHAPSQRNIYVVLAGEDGARVSELDATLGSATVGQLLSSGSVPEELSLSRIRVNGEPVPSPAHPLTMGDVVDIVPESVAIFTSPLRSLLRTAPHPVMNMSRELFGVVLHNFRGEHEEPGLNGPTAKVVMH